MAHFLRKVRKHVAKRYPMYSAFVIPAWQIARTALFRDPSFSFAKDPINYAILGGLTITAFLAARIYKTLNRRAPSRTFYLWPPYCRNKGWQNYSEGNYEEAMDYFNTAFNSKRDFMYLFSGYNAFLKGGKVDEAYSLFMEGLNLFKTDLPIKRFAAKMDQKNTWKEWMAQFDKDDKYKSLGWACSMLYKGDKGEAKKAIVNFVREDKTLDDELLYAKFLETIGDSEADNVFQRCVNTILTDEDSKTDPIGETTHEVWNYKNRVIIKGDKNKDRDKQKKSLEQQIESANIIKKIIKRHPEKKVIKPGRILASDKGLILPMWYRHGHTIMKTLEGISKEEENLRLGGRTEESISKWRVKTENRILVPELEDAADYIALLQVRYPHDVLSDMTPQDLREKIEKKLDKMVLSGLIRPGLRNDIMECYPVMEEAFSLEDAFRRYCKDGHPENWNIWTNNIIECLDPEIRPKAPTQFDPANLLGYQKTLRQTQDYIVDLHFHRFNHYARKFGEKRIKSLEMSKFIYHNAIIQRALSLYETLSGGMRESVRNNFLDNAVDGIDIIKANNPMKSSTHRGVPSNELYHALQKYLSELKTAISKPCQTKC